MSFLHNTRRYVRWEQQEWIDILTVAATGGLVFGFLAEQPGEAFSLAAAGTAFLLKGILTGILMLIMVAAWKYAGVFFALRITFEKYSLGLLLGLFLSFLSFGYIPFFITGMLNIKTIPNLRIGRFRATMTKHWERGMASAAGPMALMLFTIVLNIFRWLTGWEIFTTAIHLCFLLMLFTMIPLPLIETANPYTVYMSRLEALRNNTPGYELFFASRGWFFFLFGMQVCFAILALVFSPTPFLLVLSIVLGMGVMFVWNRSQIYFG